MPPPAHDGDRLHDGQMPYMEVGHPRPQARPKGSRYKDYASMHSGRDMTPPAKKAKVSASGRASTAKSKLGLIHGDSDDERKGSQRRVHEFDYAHGGRHRNGEPGSDPESEEREDESHEMLDEQGEDEIEEKNLAGSAMESEDQSHDSEDQSANKTSQMDDILSASSASMKRHKPRSTKKEFKSENKLKSAEPSESGEAEQSEKDLPVVEAKHHSGPASANGEKHDVNPEHVKKRKLKKRRFKQIEGAESEHKIRQADLETKKKAVAKVPIQQSQGQPAQPRGALIMDRRRLRQLIKLRLQTNGFCNHRKQSKEQIVSSIHESERVIQEVVKAKLGSMLKDLIAINRSDLSHSYFVRMREPALPFEKSSTEYVSQKDQLQFNLRQNRFAMSPFGEPRQYQQEVPVKRNLEMLCLDSQGHFSQMLMNAEAAKLQAHKESLAREANKKDQHAQKNVQEDD